MNDPKLVLFFRKFRHLKYVAKEPATRVDASVAGRGMSEWKMMNKS